MSRNLCDEPVQSLQSQIMEAYFERQRGLSERIDRRIIDDLAGGSDMEGRCEFEVPAGRCVLDEGHSQDAHEVFAERHAS